MVSSHRNRIALLGWLIALVAPLLLIAIIPEQAAAAEKKSFRPVSKTPRVLVFDLRRVDPAEVRRAWAKLRVKPRPRAKRSRLRTRSVTRKVRRAARTNHRLRLARAKRSRIRGGKLKVVVAGQPGPAEEPPGSGSGLSLVKSDPGTNPNPAPLWGSIDAAAPSRYRHFISGGPDGGPFRRLTVRDGDDFWGERAELGKNNYEDNGANTFWLYREGDHAITSLWVRLGQDYPLNSSAWGLVMQMKQTQPSSSGGGNPVISFGARNGKWQLWNWSPDTDNRVLQEWPAEIGVWTEIVFDVYYTQQQDKGSVTLTLGNNPPQQFTTNTLKRETSGGEIPVGGSIPSHLRIGPYQSDSRGTNSVDYGPTTIRTAR